MSSFQTITFFKGLNSLRFFAAFLVLLQHAESLRNERGLANLARYSIFQNGQHAVTFFFVLSGFLITYLLLKEQKETQQISIKRFYIKRIFRIWPLYFLLVFIGLVLQPMVVDVFDLPYLMPFTFGESWYYYVFFLPGLVNFYFGNHLLEPLWSIGVEEVFYLFWAPLVKWLKKHILKLLLSVIVIKLLLVWATHFFAFSDVWQFLIRIHQFEAMAIGGLGAYYVFYYGEKLNRLLFYKRFVQVLVYGVLCLMLFYDKSIDQVVWRYLFDTPLIAMLLKNGLFLYLILGVSLIDKSLFKLNNPILSFLGQISYGIYMFHLLVITQVVSVFQFGFTTHNFILDTLLFYVLVVGFTIGLAALSHRTFERFFERKKQKLLSK